MSRHQKQQRHDLLKTVRADQYAGIHSGSECMLTNSCDVHIATASSSKKEVYPNATLDHLTCCLLPTRMFGLEEFLFALGILHLTIVAAEQSSWSQGGESGERADYPPSRLRQSRKCGIQSW